MAAKLLVLHGYTMNGGLGARVGELLRPLAERVHVVAPDAPHVCSDEAVARFYDRSGMRRGPAPYCTWWRANQDNSVYEGWDASLELVRRLSDEHAPVGIVGFSQGAMAAALVAALSARGELAPLRFAVLVAGSVPRALAFRSLLAEPIELESLHVWGERDAFAREGAPRLMQHFAEPTRQSFIWAGGHSFPTSGKAADAILRFIEPRLA
jgi:pimeloyl-ACP methyl ester carboxylesterase